MLGTDIAEINVVSVAYISANAFYVWAGRADLILIVEISVRFISVFLRWLERRNLST